VEHKAHEFEGVYRAGKAVESGISVGVTNADFHPLLRDTTTEVLILRDRLAGPDEQLLFTKYAEALDAFRDSATAWDDWIASQRYSFPEAGSLERERTRSSFSEGIREPVRASLLAYSTTPCSAVAGMGVLPRNPYLQTFVRLTFALSRGAHAVTGAGICRRLQRVGRRRSAGTYDPQYIIAIPFQEISEGFTNQH
jgi:hypothetical protein